MLALSWPMGPSPAGPLRGILARSGAPPGCSRVGAMFYVEHFLVSVEITQAVAGAAWRFVGEIRRATHSVKSR